MVNLYTILDLTRSSCEQCNYTPSGRNRPCGPAISVQRSNHSVAQLVRALHRNRRFNSHQSACSPGRDSCDQIETRHEIKLMFNQSERESLVQRERASVENVLIENVRTLPSSCVRTVTIGCFGPSPFLVYPAMVKS